MKIESGNHSAHFNGCVVSENRILYCRDFAVKVFTDSDRYCMREWTSHERIKNSFFGCKKVNQEMLNDYNHNFCDIKNFGKLISDLYHKNCDKFLVAFSRHLTVIKIFTEINKDSFSRIQFYDPNNTDQCIEFYSHNQEISKTLDNLFLVSNLNNYTNNSMCIMTENKNLPRSFMITSLSWYSIGMMIRFSAIEFLKTMVKELKYLNEIPEEISNEHLAPRQILPLLNDSTLIEYYSNVKKTYWLSAWETFSSRCQDPQNI